MSHEQPSQRVVGSMMGCKTKSSMTKCRGLLILVIFCELLVRQRTCASGVFEFELMDLQRLDKPPVSATTQKLRNQQQPSYGSHMRLVLCLKDAFASQLDGPCVFGNASLTLNQQRPSIVSVASGDGNGTRGQQQQQQQTTRAATSSQVEAAVSEREQTQNQYQAPEWSKDGSQQNAQLTSGEPKQRGSHMTNVVRIPITFRWTKSFTIIITAEELDNGESHTVLNATGEEPAASNQTRNQPNKSAQVVLSAGESQTTTTTTTTTTAIDRHVLTENEVLPYLETSLQKRPTWAGRASRTDKTLIVYRFRVYCALNYYGDGCATFCRPRDDKFGHYKCAATGQRICLEGWTGQDCQQARCKEGCNQQHGFCDAPGECSCRPGWTGPRCDECLTHPGCQQGYCLGAWQCHCRKNWGGVLCDQNLDYCGTNEPCLNNATCQNVAPDRYKCNCVKGFTGVKCEHRLDELRPADSLLLTRLSAGCALNPCLNGGTCLGFEPQAVVVAAAAHGVNDSSQVQLDEAKVQEQQVKIATTTMSSQQIYRCQCPAGWTGDYCQWADALGPTITPEILSANFTNLTETPMLTTPPVSGATSAPIGVSRAPSISSDETVAGNEPTTGADLAIMGADLELMHLAQTSAPPAPHHLEMRHLISGVVVASAVGVFVAALLLAWCCLLAIERGRFHFIQMNVVRHPSDSCSSSTSDASSTGGGGGRAVRSRLRRVHEKIRDSLRRGSSRGACIKPETKLSLENVLGAPKWPPPSYEESSHYGKQQTDRIEVAASQRLDRAVAADYRNVTMKTSKIEFNNNHRSAGGGGGGGSEYFHVQDAMIATQEATATAARPSGSLVKRGALEREMALKKAATSAADVVARVATSSQHDTRTYDHHLAPATKAQINCPKHGHLYRSQNLTSQEPQAATTIAIEYQSVDKYHRNTHINHHHHHHHLNQYHNQHHQNNISQSVTR